MMTSHRIGRGLIAAALASAALLAAGCATETTYRPATGVGFDRTGFSERLVEPGRWLVSFAGNTVTPRDTVERYLLFRSAELTLQQGNDYFVMVDRDTDRQTRTYSTPGLGFGGYGGGFGGYGGGFGGRYGGGFGLGGFWGPSWRYHGLGGGWGGWGGGFGSDIQTVDRVEAEAQIVMRRGAIPSSNVRAFDAHAVVQTLAPTIVLPKNGRAGSPPYGRYGQPGPGMPPMAPQPGY